MHVELAFLDLGLCQGETIEPIFCYSSRWIAGLQLGIYTY